MQFDCKRSSVDARDVCITGTENVLGTKFADWCAPRCVETLMCYWFRDSTAAARRRFQYGDIAAIIRPLDGRRGTDWAEWKDNSHNLTEG